MHTHVCVQGCVCVCVGTCELKWTFSSWHILLDEKILQKHKNEIIFSYSGLPLKKKKKKITFHEIRALLRNSNIHSSKDTS